MAKEEIVERILSDAQAEARATVAEAEERAAAVVAAAEARAEALKAETKQEIAARSKAIAEGKAAAARLDSAKILLGEKRRVIDTVYARALEKLLALGEKECLSLTAALLERYAEDGDEVVFAENYAFYDKAAHLPVFKAKNLKLSLSRANISGGFLLRGSVSDKDLSYSALLGADREERQAELAAELFRNINT